MIDEINNLLEKVSIPTRHSLFQLHCFFMNKEPTIQAKMKKCLDEMKLKKESYENLLMELEDCADQKELIKIKIEKISDSLEGDIQKRRLNRKIKGIDKRIIKLNEHKLGLEDEMKFFYAAFCKYNSKEAWKGWDDFDVQCDYWDAKIKQEINYRLMLNLPIDLETLKTALNLPDKAESKKQVIGFLEKNFKKELLNG